MVLIAVVSCKGVQNIYRSPVNTADLVTGSFSKLLLKHRSGHSLPWHVNFVIFIMFGVVAPIVVLLQMLELLILVFLICVIRPHKRPRLLVFLCKTIEQRML